MKGNATSLEDNKKYNRIKEVLQAQGRSQVWLAESIGLSYNAVLRYCSNRRQPSLAILVDIARVMDVDVRELIVKTK